MTSFQFHFRPSDKKGREPHQGSLFARVIHKRRVCCVTLKYKLFPGEWDDLGHRVIFPPGDPPRTKYLLDTEDSLQRDCRKLEAVIDNFEDQGFFTTDDVVNAFRVHAGGGMLSTFADKLARELDARGQDRTARAYLTCYRGLMCFNDGLDVQLKHINSRLITGYETWLRENGKSLNTISFYMRNLRAIYNKAIREGCLRPRFENPFTNVYTGAYATKKRALTVEELRQLNGLDLSLTEEGAPGPADTAAGLQPQHTPQCAHIHKLKERHRSSLAMFLFCFHARGMSFVDMVYLKKENIKNGHISYFRRKTRQFMEVKITPAMQNIMCFFSSRTVGSAYVFPILSGEGRGHRVRYESALRIQNMHLKELAPMAGIEKSLSTHVARHSWATVAKNARLPIWVISEGLGHSNERTTYTYLASFDHSEIDRVSDTVSGLMKISQLSGVEGQTCFDYAGHEPDARDEKRESRFRLPVF